MKPYLLLILVCMATAQAADDQVRITVEFPRETLVLEQLDGYNMARLSDCGFLNEAGKPMLPARTVRIALPEGMAVQKVRLASSSRVDMCVDTLIHPAQQPLPMSGEGDLSFVEPDSAIYGSDKPFPAEAVTLLGQCDLAGQGIAVVRVCPLRYVPARGKLTLFTSMELVISGTGGYVCGDYLPENISDQSRRSYEHMIQSSVMNPDEVHLSTKTAPPSPRSGVGPGSYDHVIITLANWIDDFQPLADWRTRKGTPTNIVSTDWIYNQGGYTGSNLEKVRAFIEDAHNTWGAVSFLLGGDSFAVPYHVRTITVPGYWTDDINNDTYYADFDGDWVCEVHVGRGSVRNITQIATFINKVFTYEKSPPLTDYATKAAYFGFDISLVGDGYGEICKEDIRSKHLPAHFTLNTEYDTEPGVHKADVIAYINEGHHLLNHHDHCNVDVMGMGWTCHGELLGISGADALTNGARQSILFAVGCHPCDFPPLNKCIAEAFLRNTSGGCVAFMGNTCIGWGGSMPDFDSYSVKQDRFFYRNLFDDGFEKLGPNFSDVKNDVYEPNDPYNLQEYCFTQLTLLGDPELMVWTDDPKTLAVTHGGAVYAGVQNNFTVCAESGGTPVVDATACLWKDGDLYEVLLTDSSGEAAFDVTPLSGGPLLVTVTRQNHLPYEGSAEVIEGGLLLTDVNEIHQSTGGSVNFTLDAGAGHASRNYLLLGGVTGTEPGQSLPGGYATLPLNWDPFTDFVLSLLNSPVFSSFLGKLDTLGQAAAQINTPALPSSTLGVVMYYAYCLNNPFDTTSNPVEIEIVP